MQSVNKSDVRREGRCYFRKIRFSLKVTWHCVAVDDDDDDDDGTHADEKGQNTKGLKKDEMSKENPFEWKSAIGH